MYSVIGLKPIFKKMLTTCSLCRISKNVQTFKKKTIFATFSFHLNFLSQDDQNALGASDRRLVPSVLHLPSYTFIS